MNFDLSIFDATLIPALIFVLWIAGQSGIPKKFLPLLGVVLGVVAGLVFVSFTAEGIVAGILLAATSVGFHSGTKNIKEYFSGGR